MSSFKNNKHLNLHKECGFALEYCDFTLSSQLIGEGCEIQCDVRKQGLIEHCRQYAFLPFDLPFTIR